MAIPENNLQNYLRDYFHVIFAIFNRKNTLAILYGSSLESRKDAHDVDVSIIVPDYTSDKLNKIANTAMDLHLKYGFRLDFDVPYKNKILYSLEDVSRAISAKAFLKKNGKFVIDPIKMEEEFLESDSMKDRLLLNVLTTKNKLLFGDRIFFKKITKLAWATIVRVVFSNSNNHGLSKSEFIELLGGDCAAGKQYKSYLGYDLRNSLIRNHLEKVVDELFLEFRENGKLILKGGKYLCDNNWIRDLINIK
jgi:predicted nucleotidyltransferase